MKQRIAVLAVLLVFAILMGSTAFAQTLAEANDTAVQKYQDAKAAYSAAKDAYAQARQDWIAARDRYRELKSEENFESARDAVKNFLMKADLRLIKHAEVLKARAEVVSGIEESERAAIIAELDSIISGLESLQDEINAIETAEDARNVIQKVREKWNDIRAKTKRIVGEILAAKVNWVIAKAETLADRIDAKISSLKANGKDTTNLEAWVADFRSKIELAKEKYEAAKAKFAQITSVQDADRLFREGNDFLREANSYIRDMYARLREIVEELRAQGAITASAETATTEGA